MGHSTPYTEPTIWALRKNARKVRETTSSLYEHLYGYDPIKVVLDSPEAKEAVRKGSAENPSLHILNSRTNFLVREMASEDGSNA